MDFAPTTIWRDFAFSALLQFSAHLYYKYAPLINNIIFIFAWDDFKFTASIFRIGNIVYEIIWKVFDKGS